ncbi:MAG: helix-turn-helix transcriptional regulator [Treponema sp.]|nr:helix-turn-helix transcriptional regulator [Treponema sp.]
MDFGDRLRAEIEYSGMLQKELAAKAGIKKRALDMYIGTQKSMPPADVAVRLAKVLGVTVEYLVEGRDSSSMQDADDIKLKNDLKNIPITLRKKILETIHLISKNI